MKLTIHTKSGNSITLNNISNALSSSITARLKATDAVIDIKGGHDNAGNPVRLVLPVSNIDYIEVK